MKAGKYTAALLLLGVGGLLLLDTALDKNWTSALIGWWPLLLIALGVEYMAVSMVNRNAEKKVGLAFGSLFLAAAISVAAVVVTNGMDFQWARSLNINIGPISFADESGHRYEKDPVHFTVDDRTDTILLRNRNGHVTIRPGDVDEIRIDAVVFVQKSVRDADRIAGETEIRFERQGNRMDIYPYSPEYRLYGVKQRPRINMTVTVPRNLDQNWKLDLTNGKVEADGLTVRNELAADTTNGAITVRNIAGNVKADTTNGRVEIRDVGGDVRVDATNGKIILSNIGGRASVDTTHGDIHMENVASGVQVETTNGRIVLTQIGGDIQADATNGVISIDGADGAVKAETVNGDITLRTRVVAGDYQLGSTNGKVALHLPKDASIQVNGETTNGAIRADFGLEVGNKKVKGSANGGQYKVNIDTNGGIEIQAND